MLNYSWMRGVKCFFCGKDNRENDRHEREEVTEAIRKFKHENANEFVTTEDPEFITEALNVSDGK